MTQEVVISTRRLEDRQYLSPTLMFNKARGNQDVVDCWYVSDFDQKARLIAVWDKKAQVVEYTYGTFRTVDLATNDAQFVLSTITQDFKADWRAGYVR